MRKLLVVFCLAFTCSLAFATKKPTVTKAFADSNGIVHIVTTYGLDRAISPEKDQEKGPEGVENVQVAPDGRTVGWLVYSRSCCVSYAVPLELVMWQAGHIIQRIHPTMAIWAWGFVKNGKEIAYRQSPLHGGWSGERVLVKIATGRVLASWDYPVDENGNDVDEKDAYGNNVEPDWAKQIPESH